MLLIALAGGSRTMGELATMLNVTRRAITRLIDGLEEDGHVTRTRDKLDRRVFHVDCAPATRARLFDAMDTHRNRVETLTEDISTEDLRIALRVLHTLGARLNEELTPTGEAG
jgi:MarR family transcriptional regulator for hemolysin